MRNVGMKFHDKSSAQIVRRRDNAMKTGRDGLFILSA